MEPCTSPLLVVHSKKKDHSKFQNMADYIVKIELQMKESKPFKVVTLFCLPVRLQRYLGHQYTSYLSRRTVQQNASLVVKHKHCKIEVRCPFLLMFSHRSLEWVIHFYLFQEFMGHGKAGNFLCIPSSSRQDQAETRCRPC